MPSSVSRRALRRVSFVALSLATAFSVVAADTAVADAAPQKPRPKLEEGWTPYAHWKSNGDGTVTRTLYPDLTFHTDVDGNWEPIDATLEPAADELTPDVATAPDAVRPVSFGRSVDRLVDVSLDAGAVTLSAPRIKTDKPTIEGNGVQYVVPKAHAVMDFTVDAHGVKHAVTLYDATSPTSWTFHLADPKGALGKAVPTGDGGFRFDKPVADGLFLTIPAPYAFEQGTTPTVERDKDGEVIPSARLTVTKKGNGFDIVESVDAAWLTTHEFPVVLDPSLTYSGSARVVDCAVTSNATLINTADCASGTALVGADLSGMRRLLLRYDTSGFPSPAEVTNASVLITPTNASGTTIGAEIREAGASWTTGATWLTTDGSASWPVGTTGGAPGATQLGAANLAPGGAQASFSSTTLTTLVANWINGSATNNGLVLKATSESATGPGTVTVNTTESSTSANRPALQITYNAPPDKPSSVTATRGDQQATVSWTAPANNGSAITGYAVKAWQGTTLVSTTSAAAGATSKTVTGLTNGTAYTFTVNATNAIGTGPDSDPSNSVTPAGVPFAPTSVTATRGDQSADLTWTAPSGNGDAITGNTITAYVGGSPVSTTNVGAVTSATVTGLTNGTSYTFKVAATNTVGTGAQSAASNAVTPAGLPFAPTNIAVTPGNNAINVTWTAGNPNGAPITSYQVEVYENGVYLQTSVTGGTATSLTITSLTNGLTYAVKIASGNDVGIGATSALSNAVVAGTPGAPTNVTGTRGDQQVALTWTAAPANGGAVTGNTIRTYQGANLVKTDNVGAVTSATVTGLTNGTAYTFTVTATNTYGAGPTSAASASVTPAGLPFAPTNVTATAGDTQLTVTWTAASANGTPVTGYTVKTYTGGGSLVGTQSAGAAATSATVTGLTNGTAYYATVSATNSVGTGAVGTSNTVTPAGVPFAPTNVTATRGDQQLTVTWTAANDNGSALTGHTIKTYTSGGSLVSTTTATGAATSKTVTGLTNGTAYYATVTATNAVGTGAAGTSNTVTPAGLPGAPTGVSAVRGDQSAVVSWTAPGSNNGSAITGYSIKAYDGATLVSTTNVGNVTSSTVTGLTNGTAYTFKVAATNAVGTGADSTASSAVTPAGTPFAPSGVTATRGDQSASVSWTAPSGNGASITGYAIKAYDGATLVSTTNVGAVTNGTVTGLTNGTSYTFKVSATNSVGTGPDSTASNAVTPAGTPFAPTNVTADPANAAAVVYWTAPGANGSAITSFTIKAFNGATLAQTANISAPATSGTITGLTNGVTYTYKVAATNTVGTGADSAASSALVTGVPGTPTGVSAVRGDQSATVSWTAPAANGGAITGNTVKVFLNGSYVSSTNVGAVTSTVVGGLTNGSSYTFSVIATNTYGSGRESTQSAAVTPAGAPLAPPNVSAVDGDQQATVSWSPANANGSAITGYTVKAYAGATLISTQSAGAGATSAVVTGLTNGTAYSFTVSGVNAIGTGTPGASNTVTPAGLPGLPASGTATPGDTTIALTWSAANGNGATVTSYQITVVRRADSSTFAEMTADATQSQATITGLTNYDHYDVKIAAVNRVGVGSPSTLSDIVPVPATAPASAGHYVPLTPQRIADTRNGLGGYDTPLTGTNFKTFTVTGVGGVPDTGVSAVALSIAAISPTNTSYLTVWPTGLARPQVSQVNMPANLTTAGLVVAKIGANGQVNVYLSSGTAHVLIDVQGYYTDNTATTGASRYAPLVPERVVDTTTGLGSAEGATPLASATSRTFTIAGAGTQIPSTGVSAVVFALTVTAPTTIGFLTAYKNGDPRPGTSNVNYAASQTVTSLVQVPVDADGKVAVYNSGPGTAHVRIDVEGYYTTSSGDWDVYVPITPSRIYNTTNGQNTGASGTAKLNTGETRAVLVGGGDDPNGTVVIPANATAAVLSVQANTPTTAGYYQVYPGGEARPTGSAVTYSNASGATYTGTVIAKIGTGGVVNIYASAGQTHLVVDVHGYFQAEPPTAPASPTISSTTFPQNAWAAPDTTSGSVTFGDTSSDIDHYLYALDDPSLTSPTAAFPASGTTATATITPPGGWHTLYVQAVDTNNLVSPITSYVFGSEPGITSPVDGSSVQGDVALSARAPAGYSGVTWHYRRGASEGWAEIPTGDVTNNGATVPIWPTATTQSGTDTVVPTLTWNAPKTLAVDGTVEIRACFIGGNGACTAPTVKMTLDRGGDANPTATAPFGPGTLNLVTGNLSLTSTDASIDSFASDLTVARSYNTGSPVRSVPGAYEHLDDNQVDIESGVTGFNAGRVTLAQEASKAYSQAKSLKMTPSATGLSTDTYAAVGGDNNLTLRLGLQAGHSYTFTTHIYVPSSTGVAPVGSSTRADRAVAFWKTSQGINENAMSNTWTETDKWQKLTVRFTIPVGAPEAFIRLYNGRATTDVPGAQNPGRPVYYDKSSLTDEGVFGPGWMGTNLVGSADSTWSGLTDRGTQVTLHDADSSTVVFAKNSAGQFKPTGDDATSGLMLKPATIVNGTAETWTLTDLDGNRTVFKKSYTGWTTPPSLSAPHAYQVDSVSQPGSSITTTYTYSDGRVTEMLAPTPPGATCTGGSWTKGCRALLFTYNTSGHLTKIVFKTTDAGGQTITPAISCYEYDEGLGTGNTGLLLRQWDPRLVNSGGAGAATTCGSPVLATTYAYTNLRLTSVTPAGLAGVTIGYEAVSNRVSTVTRTHSGGGSEVSTVKYGVPTTWDVANQHYRPNLSAAAVATWGQTEVPFTAVAIFGPGDFVDANDLRDGSVTYLNASGRVINTASFSGTAPTDFSGWHVNMTAYDTTGNVVRWLTAANRYLALNPGGAPPGLTLPSGSANAAAALSTMNVYSSDGMDLLDTFGPYHLATLPDGTVTGIRTHQHTSYDTGAELAHPAGPTLHLAVSSYTAASRSSSAVATNETDKQASETRYALTASDATGWTYRKPMQTIVDPAGLALSTVTRYDAATGVVVETRQPSDPFGGGAGSTQVLYYTADTSSPDSQCRSKPEWVGLLCKVLPVAQPVSDGSTQGLVARATKYVQTYDYLSRPTVSVETPASGSARTTTTTFQNNGYSPRVYQTSMTGGLGSEVPSSTTTYWDTTGLVKDVSAAPTSDQAGTFTTTNYDDFGRETSYQDGSGDTTTTTYDSTTGRLTTVEDGKGTRTYSYNSGGERRGFATSVTVSGVGTFAATYGRDGGLTSQSWPNGVTQTFTRDQVGEITGLAVKYGSTIWLEESVGMDAHGRWRTRNATIGAASGSQGGAWTYTYDGVGRLSKVTDDPAGSVGCTTRIYAFDANSNRTKLSTYDPSTGGACQTTNPLTVVNHGYDTADRLLGLGSDAGLQYDSWGRIVSLPAGDTTDSAGAAVQVEHFANDLVRKITRGTLRQDFTVDAMNRVAVRSDYTNNVLQNKVTNHYSDTSDSPSWIAENTNGLNFTRNIEGLDGSLVCTRDQSGSISWKVSNLHGDVVATALNSATTVASGYVTDEFGVRQGASPGRYSWLGANQRASDALGGLTLMGVRLYAPVLGRFLQADPIPGGNANAYEYPNDPINSFDLTGLFGIEGNAFSARMMAGFAIALALSTPKGQKAIKRAVYGAGVAGYEAYESIRDRYLRRAQASGSAAGAGHVSQLPSGGQFPFKPPRNWNKKPNKGGGFKDRFGNLWRWARTNEQHGGPHWDVTMKNGRHVNVFPNGTIR